ncbi:unnamed protein product [Paramecium sonneborni]|uniref:Uncharacterized protein n=1 Tax=Paramecium sonneborni TaxID=65129 RepID=A0A8S1MD53_9CILI|nr:unnamed protein product [Paramecium sonneborni]
MGCSQEKPPKSREILPPNPPILTESDLKITIQKFQQFAIVQKQKITNEGLEWERQLKQMLINEKRDKDQEYQLFTRLTQKNKYLETVEFIILHCYSLSDQSNKIFRCQGQTQPIKHLMSYIESIIYASDKLNMDKAQQFNQYFLFYFKLDVNQLKNVSQEIQNLYKYPFPTYSEIIIMQKCLLKNIIQVNNRQTKLDINFNLKKTI